MGRKSLPVLLGCASLFMNVTDPPDTEGSMKGSRHFLLLSSALFKVLGDLEEGLKTSRASEVGGGGGGGSDTTATVELAMF